jgi:sulfate/thiosulfate transport system ATP-binding protein
LSIRVDNVAKKFGTYAALHGVSLEARPGEFLALLGPSGSGKTTLLRIMAGLEFPDEGHVYFEGRDITGLQVRERGVGFVFQQYALFRHMTVLDNVAFGLKVKKRRERPSGAAIRERARELLELVQLGDLGGRYPSQLSGGQRQRVALARALAVDPKLLLLDEPFGALDAKVRKELRRWLRELHGRMGVTSVFVTHDQEEALELADRVVVMDHGVIEQVAPPQEIYDRPASAFVHAFVGESNRLEVAVAGGEVRYQGQVLRVPERPSFDGAGHLFFRPHHVKVASGDEGNLPVVVSQVRKLGGETRIDATLAGHGAPLEIVLHNGSVPEPGQKIALGLVQASLYPVGGAGTASSNQAAPLP